MLQSSGFFGAVLTIGIGTALTIGEDRWKNHGLAIKKGGIY